MILRPHADAADGFFEGYGVHLYPDGRWGHGGGDPGVAVVAKAGLTTTSAPSC